MITLFTILNKNEFEYWQDNIHDFTTYFYKDDITWISPTLNQIHQLKNTNTENTCITIQCYMYEGDNNTHYDYFDYIDDDGKKQQYEPDSDMDFVAFKELMRKEWEDYKKEHICKRMFFGCV